MEICILPASRPVATEEQLSADFRKKLAEWQRLKGVRQPPPVPARQDLSEDFLKKWGTKQISIVRKLKQNYSFLSLFLFCLMSSRHDSVFNFTDEWKRMKETNSVPAWEEEAKPDEVLVQTSTGLFKFQGRIPSTDCDCVLQIKIMI